jgi:hypothetical protein
LRKERRRILLPFPAFSDPAIQILFLKFGIVPRYCGRKKINTEYVFANI